MKRFFVTSRIESRINGELSDSPLTEESIRFVEAEDWIEARKKAESFCKAAEHSYKNKDGETVSWHFVEVEHLREFTGKEITDGVEIYSRFNREPDE